jgi:hypothetical protein
MEFDFIFVTGSESRNLTWTAHQESLQHIRATQKMSQYPRTLKTVSTAGKKPHLPL